MKFRHSASLVVGLIVAIVALRPARPESASPTVGQLAADLAVLQTTVAAQATQIASLQSAVANLQTVQIDLQNKLQFVSVTGTEMFITGANLSIRNGVGTTAGPPNGLGNLIVGYNENFLPPSTQPRTGSHNLVVGTANGYSSFGGIVAGQGSRISAAYATVTGGHSNLASATWSSVSGGSFNTASGEAASVSGGDSKTQAADAGWTGGGFSTP